MESYKLYVNKNLVDNTHKSIENSKKNSDYDKYIYQESLIGNRVSRLTNKNTRLSHMVGNKAISFSSLVE